MYQPNSVPFSAALREQIEEMYRAFAHYTLGPDLDVCHCDVCMTEQEEQLLLTTPLREISREALSAYTGSAHGSGTERISNELRHFLPRYFELIAAGQIPHHSMDSCLKRLSDSNFRDEWPAVEVETIDRMFAALWLHWLEPLDMEHGHPARMGVDRLEEWEFFVCSGANIDELLRFWKQCPDPAATLRMADFRQRHLRIEGVHIFMQDIPSPASEIIGEWLYSTAMDKRITALIESTTDEKHLELLSGALGVY